MIIQIGNRSELEFLLGAMNKPSFTTFWDYSQMLVKLPLNPLRTTYTNPFNKKCILLIIHQVEKFLLSTTRTALLSALRVYDQMCLKPPQTP